MRRKVNWESCSLRFGMILSVKFKTYILTAVCWGWKIILYKESLKSTPPEITAMRQTSNTKITLAKFLMFSMIKSKLAPPFLCHNQHVDEQRKIKRYVISVQLSSTFSPFNHKSLTQEEVRRQRVTVSGFLPPESAKMLYVKSNYKRSVPRWRAKSCFFST